MILTAKQFLQRKNNTQRVNLQVKKHREYLSALVIILFLFIAINGFSQETKVINLKSTQNFCEIALNNNNSIIVNTSIANIRAISRPSRGGNFITIECNGLIKTFGKGEPDLPVYSKLIEIPICGDVQLKILSYDEEIINLAPLGLNDKVYPAQPSLSKDETLSTETFYYNGAIYNKDAYTNTQTTTFEYIGILRSARVGRIEIRPIQYNPVQNNLKILNNLKIEVQFTGANYAETEMMKAKYSNTLFDNTLKSELPNYINYSKTRSTSERSTYVIISDRMFATTLQPFIDWKKQLGYNVIVGYTDMIGKTTTEIKSYLTNLYNNPPSGFDVPLFVLLVGDIEQIPSFRSQVSGADHITDLYYFDYTNDNLPDVFYGRFSASSVSQLQPQIDKTIEYEKTSSPYPANIYTSVLVAGADNNYASTYGNGQINYETNYYFNNKNGITAFTYLQPEPSGGNYSYRIKNDINNGVGFVNYTAHCSSAGWVNPSFTTRDIANLKNNHKYGLWVANCCKSGRFNETECFAEAALRANGKGALGYIGTTNSSYWDEDYWWSVGFKTVTTKPTYDDNNLGAIDKLFHQYGEPTTEWHSTQGQMVIGGNLSVQSSTSNQKLYYWEIYHLFGDPSVKMRFVPQDCPSNVSIAEPFSSGSHDIIASNSISANNLISNGTLVHFGANNLITLLPGFSVSKGCSFVADLKGCNLSSINQINAVNYPTSLSNNIKTESNSNSEELAVKVFPNPSCDGNITIEISNEVPKAIIIYNILGREIYVNHAPTISTSIFIQNSGIYMLQIQLSKKTISKKVIIN